MEATTNAWRSAERANGAGEGVTTRSQFRITPPLHLLVKNGQKLVTWCTGAPALAGRVHPSQKRCSACQSLADEYVREHGDD